MTRVAVLAGALALAVACGGSDERRDPAPGDASGDPAPPSDTTAGALSPAVEVTGTPAPPPACALALSEDPPDLGATPAARLAPAWELVAPNGWHLAFAGVQDEAGNVYWHESGPTSRSAVGSATHDGAMRWRRELDVASAAVLLVAAERVLISAGAGTSDFPDRVEALDARSGEIAWRLELSEATRALVPAARGPARTGVRVDHPSVLDGVATIPVSTVDPEGYLWPGLLRVDLASGTVRELRAIATDLTIWIPGEPVVAGGLTYVTAHPTQLQAALLGFDAAGDPRVALPVRTDDNPWTLAASERFLFASGTAGDAASGVPFVQWSALDGTPLGRVATGPWPRPDVVASGSRAFVHGAARLARLELEGCGVAWERTLLRAPRDGRFTFRIVAETPPILTRAGVLVAIQVQVSEGSSGSVAGEAGWLVEVGDDGAESFRGRLPDGFLYGGGATLHRGRFVTAAAVRPWEWRLVAFDVGDREPAASGWATRHGSPSRERRAR